MTISWQFPRVYFVVNGCSLSPGIFFLDPNSTDYRGFIAKGLQKDSIEDVKITLGKAEDPVVSPTAGS